MTHRMQEALAYRVDFTRSATTFPHSLPANGLELAYAGTTTGRARDDGKDRYNRSTGRVLRGMFVFRGRCCRGRQSPVGVKPRRTDVPRRQTLDSD